MSISTLRPISPPRRPEPRDPLAEIRAARAELAAKQITRIEDALFELVEAADDASAADILHDERTRQLTDQIAAVGRRLSNELGRLQKKDTNR